MTRVVRNAALFCAAGIVVASAALANVPDPATSTANFAAGFPNLLIVEGTVGLGFGGATLSDNHGNVTVTVRDFASNPISGSVVVADFTNCSDINLSCNQLLTETGQTLVSPHKVQGTTNVSGMFAFKIQGAGPGCGPNPPGGSCNGIGTGTCGAANCPGTIAGTPCLTILADGVPLLNLRVAAFDIDRTGSGTASTATSAGDVSKVQGEALNAALGAASRARDDYNVDSVVNASDVSIEKTNSLNVPLGTGSFDTWHGAWEPFPSAGTTGPACP